MAPTTSCQSSLDVAEPVFATATEAKVWICLEYRGAWAAKAFKASDLPEEVKAPLTAALDATPGSRLQLIRRPGRTRGQLSLYLARIDRPQPDAFRLDFNAYSDLQGMDFRALAAGTPPAGATLVQRPWVLVCGNGRRDVCCARHGTAVYRALAHLDGAEVWLSNHQGGHRFAANVVVLPYGVQFGRVRPGLAPGLIMRCLAGDWDLDHTRGHVAYPRPAQAAEHFLRQRTGELGRDAFRLLSAEALSPDRWRVLLQDTKAGRHHTVDVVIGKSTFEVVKTTGDPAPSRVPRYTPA
jgi:hypothetical protein